MLTFRYAEVLVATSSSSSALCLFSAPAIRFSLEYYHQFQTFLFTVEEINKDPNILPNMTVGFQMYETCNIPHYELQGALQFLTDSSTTIANNECNSRPMFPAVIGSTVSANSIILAHFLGTFRYPQISPFSSVSILSNRNMFPSFFRTFPSDIVQSKGMAQLILRFGWTWIGLLALDNDYGIRGTQPIKEDIIKAGACVAFMEYISLGQPDRNAPRIVKVMKESSAKVVVVFTTEVEFIPILNEMIKQNLTGKIFIGNTGWAKSLLLSISKYFQLLSGSLSLASNDYTIPGFSQFLAKIHPSTSTTVHWTTIMWETVFNCQFVPENQTVSLGNPMKVCTGSEHIDDIKNNSIYIASLKMTYVMFAAVHVLFKALDDLKTCKFGEGPFSKRTCANIWNFKPWQLMYYMRRVSVNINLKSEKYFDENGDPPGLYAVDDWQLKADGTLAQVKIGIYNNTAPPPQDLTLNSNLTAWNPGSQQLILCISWMSVDPPHPHVNTEDKAELIIIDCNDRSVAFWAMLGYLFLLATISFIVAFLARKLPDSFNEAQFITFSMLAFLSVWLSFIPASLSAQGKYTVAMEVFAILASSWALLICMFCPKCFILLFRPEMNSKEYLIRNKDKGAISKL
ncbi:extracellular calcium-sensing receptor-like [Ranitomeya imitator]|uniref:extracellular calcium-sensing receptor-like n=1 Tax=Ranitomeya imitator TaxID=111125 RepID=UPI0037E944E0